MVHILIYVMIYLGSALMAYNIIRYVRFSRRVRKRGNWDEERRLLNIPIVLLVLFLAGYLAVGIFGDPDLIISGILFGGSIFVFVMLILIERTAERIQENERLEAKVAAAEEANRAKTFFLSNMSHDIRTPLNAITGYTHLAGRPGVTSEEKSVYIEKIDRAGHQLLDIVNDVLEMSRIESGSVDLEPIRMDIEKTMHEAGDLVRNQMDSKHLDFSIGCEVKNRWVLCDKSQLNRVLMNLLCNAGKFTGEGGKVSLILRELSENDDTCVYEIRVKDTGIGMSPEFVEHIFTPFERERTSTISRIQGTGLGMAITKNIVDRMGGSIEVKTEQGRGSEFIVTVELPVIDAPKEEAAASRGRKQAAGKRLLLVEDNPVNLEIAKMMLTHAGFAVEEAGDGARAVEMIESMPAGYYDAVLMDIQMPVMDGYTAARRIRALSEPAKAQVPIIAMTANAFQEDIQSAPDAGMNGHIAKPLDEKVMLETIAGVLCHPERSEGSHADGHHEGIPR